MLKIKLFSKGILIYTYNIIFRVIYHINFNNINKFEIIFYNIYKR